MTPTEIHQLAVHAASQTVGYWGAVMTFVLIAGGAWLGRYGLRKFEELLKELSRSQKEQVDDLKESQSKLIELLSGVIIDNTRAYEAAAGAQRQSVHELHELRRSIVDKCPGGSAYKSRHLDNQDPG